MLDLWRMRNAGQEMKRALERRRRRRRRRKERKGRERGEEMERDETR